MLMSAKLLLLLGVSTLPLLAATSSARAFEVTSSVWERFTLDQGRTAGLSLRGYRMPQFAPSLTPLVGLNYENAQAASAVRGAWMEAARMGSFSMGPVLAVDRSLALSTRGAAPGLDAQNAARYGGFLAYTAQGQEIGRLSLTTGRLGGLDIKASRSFKLTDNLSLDIGPTISLGSFERFGYAQASAAARSQGLSPASSYSADRAQLGAFGLATAIESRISERTVARMFADYARIEAQRSLGAGAGLQGRDRVDFGFSLTTTIGQ
jgi:hypothetical protein